MLSQNFVREFYTKIENFLVDINHPSKFTVFYRDHRVPFAPSILRKILGLLLVPNREYNAEYLPNYTTMGRELIGQLDFQWNVVSHEFPTPSLTTFHRILHQIALTNWYPNSHASFVTGDIARFLYVVGTGVAIDLTKIIFDKIVQSFQTKSKRLFLPYPCLIH